MGDTQDGTTMADMGRKVRPRIKPIAFQPRSSTFQRLLHHIRQQTLLDIHSFSSLLASEPRHNVLRHTAHLSDSTSHDTTSTTDSATTRLSFLRTRVGIWRPQVPINIPIDRSSPRSAQLLRDNFKREIDALTAATAPRKAIRPPSPIYSPRTTRLIETTEREMMRRM